MLTRRRFLLGAAGAAAAGAVSRRLLALAPAAPPVEITVYKDPSCGCCKQWVAHMEANGFKAKTFDTADMASVKKRLGVPDALQSCHTGFVGGYAIEGHVPAADVQRLLREKPKVVGIAVPGMPVGSPGMEMGARKDTYDVVAFAAGGKTSIFAKH
jgi:hypothetical protein